MGYIKRSVPYELVIAQELQKAKKYKLSRESYMSFFTTNPSHILRFKALFEVADNYFHEGLYLEAVESYDKFLDYCNEQTEITEDEKDWVNAYTSLTISRKRTINKQ